MDILIGIALALAALLLVILAFGSWSEATDNIRNASPGTKAIFGIAMAFLLLILALNLGHAAGERFGWWDDPAATYCTVTHYEDAEGNETSSATSCTDER